MAVLPNLKSIIKVKGIDLREIRKGMAALAASEILVGFPEDTTVREDMGIDGITNAALGYIHDNGQPERNIPARPFMVPGITEAQDKIADQLGALAKRIVRTKQSLIVEPGMHRVGITAMVALKKKINEGIPPPLAEATLRNRMRRGKNVGKSAKFELERRAQGEAPSTEFAKPLIDTGALRNSINYVIRKRKDRK